MQDNVPPDSSANTQVENRPLARPRRSSWWQTFWDRSGSYISVALGSVVGAVARFLVSVLSVSQFGDGFPWGTLFVNVTGSFAIGFYAALTGPDGRLFVSPRQRQFVMVGICGGYTTFSSFSLETLRLVQSGNTRTALIYLLVSAITWLVGVWLGHALAARLNRL
ncbi:MAG: fluoride efflux transporter CrcB [Bradyrhizobium sp.]|uniref:fluoride efflux transporter CrcB n=1 Tax=Bradyrhizobium sp. TaxID=376 RepID=UPI001C287F8E|nr:fluoride efflux transporter CrcB [Bradyrhizobium sp.]MBU6462692.1 fluoride efflux transporter CrcB [Pseudomonadota bacterium]MDE2067826.1 fluoride efflux transporter CrcB [Bradyrhizobium sp.]MDE2242900.1 fluoride efflux transporter CrcB [Bradyrhizobium sp.]MDE2472236.1 fluoride efflux transporter CrcB [Bradyrhizobium sp.]